MIICIGKAISTTSLNVKRNGFSTNNPGPFSIPPTNKNGTMARIRALVRNFNLYDYKQFSSYVLELSWRAVIRGWEGVNAQLKGEFQTGSLLNNKRIPWMFVGKETPVLYFSILTFG